VPEDFAPEPWIEKRRVYDGRDETDVAIRYKPSVARFVREDAGSRGLLATDCVAGAVQVTWPVADWDWVVHHVLAYGAEAEVVGPPEVRDRVRVVLEGMGERT